MTHKMKSVANLVLIGCLVAAPMLLTGFLHKKFTVVGQFEDSDTLFTGTIRHNIFSGNARIEVTSEDNQVSCKGLAVEANSPTIAYAVKNGTFNMECTDGRSMTGEWLAQSLSQGYGTGFDNDGHRFYFAFAQNARQAQSRLDELKSGIIEVKQQP